MPKTPASPNLIAQVISKTRKKFIGGYIYCGIAFRNAIKHDIKTAINEKPDKWERIFEEMYEKRVYGSSNTNYLTMEVQRHLFYAEDDMFESKLAEAIESGLSETLKAEIKSAHFSDLAVNDEVAEKNGYGADRELKIEELIKKLRNEIKKDLITTDDAIRRYFKKTVYDKVTAEFQNENKKSAKDFKLELKKEICAEILENKPSPTPLKPRDLTCSTILLYEDPFFPIYDANWIAGSNFIAAKGPQIKNIANLIQEILFNPKQAEKPRITTIVGLGCILSNGKEYPDFINYSFDDRNESERGTVPAKTVDYVNEKANLKYHVAVTNEYVSPRYVINEDSSFPAGFIRSKLEVVDTRDNAEDKSTKQLEAILIAIPDGDPLFLEGKNPETEKLIELLWTLAQKSKTEGIVFHCRGGHGRTGNLILTLEILKNYESIFASGDPDIIADNIEQTLNRIRANRPPLVTNLDQYRMAIKNAHIIYSYAFEKKYIQEAGIEMTSVSDKRNNLWNETNSSANQTSAAELDNTLILTAKASI
jgi:protein-tyrosine phosphatase